MLQPILQILNAERIVLASGSPRRKQILENVGLKFEVIPSTFEETLDKTKLSDPTNYVVETARHKTQQVAKMLIDNSKPVDLVIGADTVVAMNGKIFEKPRDKADAFQMLSGFSGKSHTVYTGVILMKHSGHEGNCFVTHSFCEATEVFMTTLMPDIINAYINTGEPLDKAGGYGIQGLGGTLVEKVHGDFFNVMGFPLSRFARELLKLYKFSPQV